MTGTSSIPTAANAVFPSSAPVAPGERVDALLVAVIVYTLVSVAHINEILPFLMPLRPAIISVLIALALYLSSATGRRSLQRLFRQRGAKLVTALFFWSLVTVPLALAPGASFRFVLDGFSKTAIMYLLIVGVTRGTRDLERNALWYFLGTAIYALYAMRNSGAMLGDDWRMAQVSGNYDANDFAVYCVTGLPLAIHYVRNKGPTWVRLIAAWAIVSLTMSIVMSGSRGGFIAVAAAGAFMLTRTSSIALRWRVGGIIAVVLTISMTASEKYWDQMRTILDPSEDYNVTAETGRLGIWKRGLGYAVQFPISGVGAFNFGVAEGTVSEQLRRLREQGIGTPWSAPHNTYVQVVAEMGFPGLLIFLALLIAAWRSLSIAEGAAPNPRLRSLVQALKTSTAGMLVGIFFLSHAYTPMLYAVLALAAAAGKTITRNSRMALAPQPPPAVYGPTHPLKLTAMPPQ